MIIHALGHMTSNITCCSHVISLLLNRKQKKKSNQRNKYYLQVICDLSHGIAQMNVLKM